eukprot:TRINITY_DN98_c0_g1_i7.p1 TRINITY_DN98_c0_g1~~TRINITY_DN98_c0_g1_i7.p1  ORF type:complete len:155 (-),score=40.10 TRINITY_DN98_c0_g1_i7:118-582(-)
MQAAMSITRVVVPNKISSRRARVATIVKGDLKESTTKFVQVTGLAAASLSLALSANALTIKMGSDDGSLVFEPATSTAKTGEEITFVNNKGFPHNIIFDEDAVPSGVDADAISAEDYLNSAGETHVIKLSTAGSYGFYCQPHQGAGMVGTITVQ